MPISETFNIDCMGYMKNIPDKYFDLSLVDPPYGINADIKNNGKTSDSHEKKSKAKINNYKNTDWDSDIPTDNYFSELLRISKNQSLNRRRLYGLSLSQDECRGFYRLVWRSFGEAKCIMRLAFELGGIYPLYLSYSLVSCHAKHI